MEMTTERPAAPIPQPSSHRSTSASWPRCCVCSHEQLLTNTAPGALEGHSGASSDGAIWHVRRDRLIQHRPNNPRRTDTMLLIPREPAEIAPGAVHVPDWLSIDEQRHLVEECRGWAEGPAPMRHTRLPNGGVMSVQTVCLGWHWAPYRYTRTADDVDGAPVAAFPDWLVKLGQKALADAWGIPSALDYRPDAALINFYDEHAKLGMHQDKDERSEAPVVSLSIGDTCTFRFGNTHRRGRPYTDLELCTGDLFVFGGPSRLAYHGVTDVQPGTADPRAGLSSGRLNLTLRVTGLAD
jgi:alkylated DNA repair protein (DNA oxidative demethylase)